MRIHTQLKKLFARVLISMATLAMVQSTGAGQSSGSPSATSQLENARAHSQTVRPPLPKKRRDALDSGNLSPPESKLTARRPLKVASMRRRTPVFLCGD